MILDIRIPLIGGFKVHQTTNLHLIKIIQTVPLKIYQPYLVLGRTHRFRKFYLGQLGFLISSTIAYILTILKSLFHVYKT